MGRRYRVLANLLGHPRTFQFKQVQEPYITKMAADPASSPKTEELMCKSSDDIEFFGKLVLQFL
jgi:hypothetical protein